MSILFLVFFSIQSPGQLPGAFSEYSENSKAKEKESLSTLLYITLQLQNMPFGGKVQSFFAKKSLFNPNKKEFEICL